ncbi:MAG: hypothetical protein AUJ56_07840 [Zetaproteobacteria bacterium CG1_02_49_23]|nr:MAG: hypothetical protein AUJ56_07840 [Zetaproteobacteria bacterium CG1_02_49_23]
MFFFGLSMVQNVSAREFADIYVDCGLGAMIAPKTPVVAAVTNVTWDLGTTAMSSNYSSPESCKGGSAKTAAFINDSYAPIENELARGEGDYLTAMMTTAGCDEAAQPALSSAVRKDFADRVASTDYAHETGFQHAEGLYNILQNQINNNFSKVCSVDFKS